MTQETEKKRHALIQEAKSWMGTPYQHQASLKGVGCDCLGLIRGLWRTLYGAEPERVPPYTPHWGDANEKETLYEGALRYLTPCAIADKIPGDVLLFRWRAHHPARHMGILSDPAHFIHAYQGACVTQTPLSPWWQRHIAYVLRM